MLSGLPYPVQLWLSNSGIVGKEKAHAVRLKQKGLMRSKPEQKKWMEMKAEQYFTIDQPSFIWRVNMKMMPLISITGRDKYVDGKGQMTIKILSLLNVAKGTVDKIDQGTLQRWLAEICWFPSAALSPYIKWEVIDSVSAKATLSYKGVTGSIIFYFNEQGDLTGCRADRYYVTDDKASLEKWVVEITGHKDFHGIRIPYKSKVTWKLKTGDFN